MPVLNIDGTYSCSICKEIYTRDVYAYSCEKGHDMILIPFKREDVRNLVQFLYTGDSSLLTKSLMDTLLKYRSNL